MSSKNACFVLSIGSLFVLLASTMSNSLYLMLGGIAFIVRGAVSLIKRKGQRSNESNKNHECIVQADTTADPREMF